MAGRGKGALRIAIEDFLETFDFGNILFGWYSKVLERFEESAADFYGRLAETLYPGVALPDNLSPARIGALVKSHQVGFFGWLVMIAGLALGGFFGLGVPSGRVAGYTMDQRIRSYRPSPSELYPLVRRYPALGQKLEAVFADLGVPELIQQAYEKATEQILTPNELAVLWKREKLDDTTFIAELLANGWTQERIQMVRDLTEVIPPPSDLITMAVKEAFDPEAISRFGLGQDFPAEFALWAKRQGISQDWAERYWASHWQLPAPGQVFEMLHRLRPGRSDDPVTIDTVDSYLKAADYSPYWRGKLREISYAPFTRVDVRRMYKTRTLNIDQVKEAYLDLGYNEERAQALTDFTIKFETEEETGIMRSAITGAYKTGFVDRGKASSMLQEAGYDETSIAFYLDSIDFTNDLEVRNIRLANIHKRYIEGVTDETTVNQEVNMLNLPGEKVTALLALWSTERDNQTALPTTSQIEVFYERGIATKDDFVRIFKLRGYTTETIGWTLQRIDQEAQEKAKKEVEAAQKEADTLNKSKTASIYQKNKADLDLEIAKARAELTDIAIALHAEIDEFTAGGFIQRQDELKAYIAAVNVRKAELKQELAGTRLRDG